MLAHSLIASFVLACATPVMQSADPSGDELVGWYEFEPGRHALVTWGASGGLRLFDFDEPSFDVLEPHEDRFRWQRQHENGAAEIDFQCDAAGKATGFIWSSSGGSKGTARRDVTYGYEQAEIRYKSGDTELCGLLMLPPGTRSRAGAVIIQGSGDSDRDNVWAFSIANHLALGGIAVLLPDKRGSGKSKGDWKAVGFDELAGDALAGLEVVGSRPEVDPARIGLVGLSQGGWIAPLAASRSTRVAYAVSISGAAVTVHEQVLHELVQTVRANGGSEETIGLARDLMQMALAYGESGEGWDDYLSGVEAAPSELAGVFPTARDDWRWSWYQQVLSFDPLPSWKAIQVPSLLVYGEDDEMDNVPVEESVGLLRKWIDESGRNNVDVRVYPGSGHALGDPATGWVRRDFLDYLVKWIASSTTVK